MKHVDFGVGFGTVLHTFDHVCCPEMCYTSQWELYIKSELAYGNQQRGRHIYPGAALIFELEMLKVYS